MVLRRVSPRYVLGAAEMLNLADGKPAAMPCVTSRKKRDPVVDHDPELGDPDKSLFRPVVAKLLCLQDDYVEASFETEELARKIAVPCQ